VIESTVLTLQGVNSSYFKILSNWYDLFNTVIWFKYN